MVKYPYAKINLDIEENKISYSNRGMDFESVVNSSNNYYSDNDIALIYKRPTPIHIVKVDYEKARIKDAYFEKQSTTDYNGIYKGKYIDFECKETKSKTSLALHNISSHQTKHLQRVQKHGGIAFFLIFLVYYNEVYLLDASIVVEIINKKERKSIPFDTIRKNGVLVEQGYIPRLKYLDAVEKVYFNEKITTNNK